MSYDISFKVKVEGLPSRYIEVGGCSANTTWNLREMMVASTGLEWKNEENNGLCKDVIPKIAEGYQELLSHPDKYKKYEAENGWGTVEGCRRFFSTLLLEWEEFCEARATSDLKDVTYFWIE